MTPETPNTNRPYAPPSNIVAVLKRLRSRKLPERIDTDYVNDAGIPGGTTARTLSGLRFLGLIDEGGVPSEDLRAIQKSTDEEYKAILSDRVKAAYAEVFGVLDPAEDSQDKILNFFRRYEPASQRPRMVIFFLGMCRESGIATVDVPRQRAMGGQSSAISRSQPAAPRSQPLPKDIGGGDRRARTATAQEFPIHPALEGLMRSLPTPGEPLSPDRRDRWLAMAEATLIFTYPEERNEVEEANDGSFLCEAAGSPNGSGN